MSEQSPRAPRESRRIEYIDTVSRLPVDRHAIRALCNAAYAEDILGVFDEVGPGRHALLRVDGSIVSRVMIVPRTVQIGDGALLQAFESQMHENDIAALSPSDADFHARFDRESWRGPLAERTSAGIQQSPDDECVMIQRLPRTPSSIDLDALLSDRVARRWRLVSESRARCITTTKWRLILSQSTAGEDGAHRGEWRRPIAAVALVAMLTACANPARIPSNSGALYGTVSDPPAWMVGLWRRDWIEMRGVRSSPTEVHYLQSARQFADVRLPHSRARLAHARSFDDLTNDDLRLLAQQRGFTGPATARGDTVTWGHEIDFQPPDDTPDVGRVQRLGAERMHEIALDRSYVESWRLEDGRERSSVVVRVEQAGRLHEVLVVVGDDFFYVRNRATDLPHAVSLDALMTATNASRAQMIAYLDCEFSTGRVRAGRVPWDVQLSTLPWREGHPLAFAQRMKRSLDSTSLVVVVGPTARATIALNTLSKAALASLFPPPP